MLKKLNQMVTQIEPGILEQLFVLKDAEMKQLKTSGFFMEIRDAAGYLEEWCTKKQLPATTRKKL